MGIDYYKLYLRKFCGSYEDAKICENEEKLLKLIDINYNNYSGCLIIGRDKQNNEDIIVGSRWFNNEKVKEEKKRLADDSLSNVKKTKHQKVKTTKQKTNQGKRLVKRRK